MADIVPPPGAKGGPVLLRDMALQSPEDVDIRGGRIVRLREFAIQKGSIDNFTATTATIAAATITALTAASLTLAGAAVDLSEYARLDGADFTGALTVNSNTVWHAGNDGAASGLDADLLRSYAPATNATASTIVLRGTSGEINVGPSTVGSPYSMTLTGTGLYTTNTNATQSLTVSALQASGGYLLLWGAHSYAPYTGSFALTARSGATEKTLFGDIAGNLYWDGNLVYHAGLPGPGTGDVVGPGSAVNNNVAVFDGTTGKLIKDGGAALSAYLLSSSYTAADVLSKLLTVDGTGTGLDADLLDGNHAAAFALLSGATFTGNIGFSLGARTIHVAADATSTLSAGFAVGANIKCYSHNYTGKQGYFEITASNNTGWASTLQGTPAGGLIWDSVTLGTCTIWHSGNDGSGTGLDADTVDGSHASAFAASSHTHGGGDITSGTISAARLASSGSQTSASFLRGDGVWSNQIVGNFYATNLSAWNGSSFGFVEALYASFTQSTGSAPMFVSSTTVVSNLNADLLDGSHASAFAAASHSHAASDISSGTIATARLGSGTANSTKFLRGDQTWADLYYATRGAGNAVDFTWASNNLGITIDASYQGVACIVSAVNSVSPTSPNRTLTIAITGTTYYIHAKTTND